MEPQEPIDWCEMSDFRSLPKVDVLAASASLSAFPPVVRADAARRAIAWARLELSQGRAASSESIANRAGGEASALMQPSLRQAINAAGVVLHTGLGRARLADEAVKQIAAVAQNHAMVEFDGETGGRGDRQSHVEALLCQLTGAEAALVVNNAAAGVFLSLHALADGGEVILSRGQMVEIGGSFRMPDIVRQSGCILVEVGCTNKTRLSDYAAALGENTRALLRCHPSNFRIVGFTEEPEPKELAELARSHGVPLIDDMGSGCLVDTLPFGLPRQTTLQDVVASGADLAIASGDKLLGGPQAGILVGKRDRIAAVKMHPLARAVRIDKLNLAALEATLRLYTTGQHEAIPTLRALAMPIAQVGKWANRLAKAYRHAAVVEQGITEVGGGCAPGIGVPTRRVGLSCDDPVALLGALRSGNPPVIARIERDRVWLDPRTLDAQEVAHLEGVLRGLDA